MDKLDLLVKGGEVWTLGGFVESDIAVSQGKIIALGKPPALPESADSIIDAKGKKVIPGLIDTHTHHRDPGFTHKEDLTTATMAAAAGVHGLRLNLAAPAATARPSAATDSGSRARPPAR